MFRYALRPAIKYSKGIGNQGNPMNQITERDAREILANANSRNVDKIIEQYADDATFQVPGQHEPLIGKDAIRTFFEENYTAFPDWSVNPKTVAVSGNEVLVVESVSGTHEGPLTDFDGNAIPPTHRKVVLDGMTHIVLDASGKIKSFRVYGNPMEMPKQLGVAPQPP
jgi:steroid delta-isomerase-like uncharacterized protein